jgi:hypothetical protein
VKLYGEEGCLLLGICQRYISLIIDNIQNTQCIFEIYSIAYAYNVCIGYIFQKYELSMSY